MCISLQSIFLSEIWKHSFPLTIFSLQMLGFRVFLACIVKGAETGTAGFSRKEQQFNLAVWCRKLPSTRDAAPGSGVSWGPGAPGAAAVSAVSCSSGTKQSLERNPFHLKEMHLCWELCACDLFCHFTVTYLFYCSPVYFFSQDLVTLINCSLLKYYMNISISLLFLVHWRELFQNLTQFVSWLVIS